MAKRTAAAALGSVDAPRGSNESGPTASGHMSDARDSDDGSSDNDGSDHDGLHTEHGSNNASAGASGPGKIHGRPTKKQRKQITAQEVQLARETAELFKSNIFKLQIDELMSEVKIKDQHIARIEKVLHRLHDCISQVPAVSDLSLEEAEALIPSKKAAIAFPDPRPTKANYTFAYLAPSDVSLVGLFGLKTGIAQHLGLAIDIALTMPASLFQHKDYLNYRALYKRSFYLAYLADQLISITKKNHLPVKISYTYLNDDVLCPVLRLESINTDNEEDLCFHKTKFAINLLAALPFGVFEAKKLLPDKNCIRVQTDVETLPPTPYYNSLVLSLTTYDYYLKFLYANRKAADLFKSACVLGRLWLQQRDFGSAISKGGFGHFEFAMLLSALLAGGGTTGNKILLHGFSSYQLFKGAIKYLATMDLASGYLSLNSLIGEGSHCKYVAEGFNTPTIFDKAVKLNLLWKMTRLSYQELQGHAKNTLVLLNDNVFDRFDSILLQKSTNPYTKYDIVYEVDVPEAVQDSFGPLEKISFITFDNFVCHKLHSVLLTALGERVTSLSVLRGNTISNFPLVKRKPSSQDKRTILLGIQLNPDECDKLVTKGPDDADPAAAKFIAFWGPKASLRKFRNGVIQHCVVWSAERNEAVVTQIIKHSLGIHFYANSPLYLRSVGLAFNARLPMPQNAPPTQAVTSTTNFTQVKSAFEALSKLMYAFELPLGIKSMLPASAGFRGTLMLQPSPFSVNNPDFWNDVILQFESSTRWPDEILAMEKTKAAFLLKVGDLLTNHAGYKTYLTKEQSIPFNENIVLLNVLTPEGFGFRFLVLSERDEILYLRAVANAGNLKLIAQNAYLAFNQRYLGSIKHTRTIGILSTAIPYYSPTVRLFKMWLDAHALLSHLSEELVELIALKPFVDPAPYSIPCSTQKGFLRILDFLANWNWKDEPLILDLVKPTTEEVELDKRLSDKLSVQTYQLIQSNFENIRKSDPSCMKNQFFVGTRDDPLGILWSSSVGLPIASRITALARAASRLARESVSESNLDLMFTPALEDFDFVIKVKAQGSASSVGIAKTTKFKNLAPGHTSFPSDLSTRCDMSVELAEMLSRQFGNAVIFSWRKCPALVDEHEGVICGVFMPSATGKKKFRVTLGLDVKPNGEGDEVMLDKTDVMDQIKLLGGDLIKDISHKK